MSFNSKKILARITSFVVLTTVLFSQVGFTRQASAVGETETTLEAAEVSFTFHPTNINFNKFEVTASINGTVVGELKGVVPLGRYVFPIDVSKINYDPNVLKSNKLHIDIKELGAGHSYLISEYKLFLHLRGKKQYVIASSQEEADKLGATLESAGTNIGKPDIVVSSDPSFDLKRTPADGEMVPVRFVIRNLGNAPSGEIALALSADRRNGSVLIPLASKKLASLAPGAESLYEDSIKYVGGDDPYASLVVEASLAKGVVDFDPDNNANTLMFYIPKDNPYQAILSGRESSFVSEPRSGNDNSDTRNFVATKESTANRLELDKPTPTKIDQEHILYFVSLPGPGELALSTDYAEKHSLAMCQDFNMSVMTFSGLGGHEVISSQKVASGITKSHPFKVRVEAKRRYYIQLDPYCGQPANDPATFNILATFKPDAEREYILKLGIPYPTKITTGENWYAVNVPSRGYLGVFNNRYNMKGAVEDHFNIDIYSQKKSGDEAWIAGRILFSQYDSDKPFITQIDKAGIYYIRLTSYGDFISPDPPTFNLRAEFSSVWDTNEPNDTPETATKIEIGKPFAAFYAGDNDKDYFSFVVSKRSDITIESYDTVGNSDLPVPPQIEFYDSQNKQIEWYTGVPRTITLNQGRYYVVIRHYNGASITIPLKDLQPIKFILRSGEPSAKTSMRALLMANIFNFFSKGAEGVAGKQGPSDVHFVLDEDAYEVKRDLNQYIKLKLRNDSDKERKIIADIKEYPDDLAVGFVSAGSREEPITLAPGEERDVLLGIFADRAWQEAYATQLYIIDAQSDNIIDTEPFNFNVAKPESNLRLLKGAIDPLTLATKVTLRNDGDNNVTGISVTSDDIGEKIVMSPVPQDVEIPAHSEKTFTIVPILDENFKGLNGNLTLNVGPQKISTPINFLLPEGKMVYPITQNLMSLPISSGKGYIAGVMNPDTSVEVQSSGSINCANKKKFDVVFGFLDFLADIAIKSPLKNLANPFGDDSPWGKFWGWYEDRRQEALRWYKDVFDGIGGDLGGLDWLKYPVAAIGDVLAKFGTKDHMIMLGTSLIPVGKIFESMNGVEIGSLIRGEAALAKFAEIEKTGEMVLRVKLNGQILYQLKKNGILSEAVTAARAKELGWILQDIPKGTGGMAAVGGGLKFLKPNTMFIDTVGKTEAYWRNVTGIHEAAHLLGASEYNAYKLQAEAWKALSFSEKLKQPFVPAFNDTLNAFMIDNTPFVYDAIQHFGGKGVYYFKYDGIIYDFFKPFAI